MDDGIMFTNKKVASEFHVEPLTGFAIEPYIEQMIGFRLKYFKQFPYLYEGNAEDETAFFEQYKKPSGRVIIVKNQEELLCGFITGIAVCDSDPFPDKLEAIVGDKSYYIGEAIFDELARGKGLLKVCLSYLDDIKQMGYTKVCFMTVIREENHSLKPVAYQDHEQAWQYFGFVKSDQTVTIPWPVIQPDGTSLEQENILNVWVKNL